MKLFIVLFALSLVVISEGKPLEDNERKCIVKYLSEKGLLSPTFVVDPVLPDNCDELLSARIFEIYFDVIYHGEKPEEDDWFQVDYIFKRSGVADVVLKSFLYEENSEENANLKKTVNIMRNIADLIDSWKNHKLSENIKNLQIKSPDSSTKLCLKNHVTTEVFPNYVETKRFDQLEKYDIKDLECDNLITSFQKHLEVHLLETFPKSGSDNKQLCIKNSYNNLNMTEKFSDVFAISIMKEITLDDTYHLYNSYCYRVAAFYEQIMECARLGFILKDVPEVRNVYSIDFTREGYMFTPKYDENFGVLVKINVDQSLSEILLIANQTSELMNNSQCLLDGFKDRDLRKMSLKMMAAEDNYEVGRVLDMKRIMLVIFRQITHSCKTRNDANKMFDDMYNGLKSNNQEMAAKMKCFRQFVTEEKVNGITYFRVNIDVQPNDKKCQGILEYLEHMEHSENTDPEDVCMLREVKKLNLYKVKWDFEVLAEIGISSQQKEEERIKFNELMIKAIEMLFNCQKEAFDLI